MPVVDVQRGLDLLRARGSVLLEDLGKHRAFVGAVLGALPGATFLRQPARVILSLDITDDESVDPAFGDFDREVRGKVRREQAKLRRLLLAGAETGTCALCGDAFPGDFLVAAHVKFRSFCDSRERADLANVAMLVCVFGCDALFEKGYVMVDAYGRIAVAQVDALTAVMRRRLAALDGKECIAFGSRSAVYFEWHRDAVFRR